MGGGVDQEISDTKGEASEIREYPVHDCQTRISQILKKETRYRGFENQGSFRTKQKNVNLALVDRPECGRHMSLRILSQFSGVN